MNKKQKKLNVDLIVVDLDHTLVAFGHEKIGLLDAQAIKFAKEKNKEVVIATGRSFRRSIQYSRDLKLNYHICFGGALLYSLAEERVLHFVKINEEKLEKIFNSELLINSELFTTFYCYDEKTGTIDSYYLGKTNKAFNEFNINLTKFKSITHTKELVGKAVVRMNVFGDLMILDEISNNFKSVIELNIIKNYDRVLEITEKNSDKGSALKILANKINVDKNRIMAIGDSYNDLSMFKVAKYGIAVENSVEELKKHAHDITDNYQNKGVGKALFKLLDLN